MGKRSNSRKLVELLTEKSFTIGSAESMTGGAFTASIIRVHNASKVINKSFITYDIDSKVEVLGIDRKIIEEYGVVSKEVALLMASRAQALCGATIGVGISGYATNTRNNDEVFGCFVGISYLGKLYYNKLSFKGFKGKNIDYTCKIVTSLILSILKRDHNGDGNINELDHIGK